ncbi:hypothetical protein P9112_002319 [Eukaryota sp. TZLM1-RC]
MQDPSPSPSPIDLSSDSSCELDVESYIADVLKEILHMFRHSFEADPSWKDNIELIRQAATHVTSMSAPDLATLLGLPMSPLPQRPVSPCTSETVVYAPPPLPLRQPTRKRMWSQEEEQFIITHYDSVKTHTNKHRMLLDLGHNLNKLHPCRTNLSIKDKIRTLKKQGKLS